MSKAKTNALDALRALIAERQQYEQWISALEAKREGTPEHVFDRVRNDYRTRLDKVVGDIRGYAEELQLSISTLSSRLVEVARDEDTRREGLQEAELRAAVGEYEPEQWQQLKSEAEEALGKIATDRASLDSQLGELRAIQKLSEVGSVGSPPAVVESPAPSAPTPVAAGQNASPESSRPIPTIAEPDAQPEKAVESVAAEASGSANAGHRSGTAAAGTDREAKVPEAAGAAAVSSSSESRVAAEPLAAAIAGFPAPVTTPTSRQRPLRTPPGGVSAARAKQDSARPDNAKTLKCPECGTANYPTEWYCERCGGELATM